MRELILETQIFQFDTCKEFVAEFAPNENDVILTNEYIFTPALGSFGIASKLVFQEQYGKGEPSDEMVRNIIAAIGDKKYDRVFGIGGGTIIDIAKILAVYDGRDLDELYADTASIKKQHELIILPTTCGTGSEVTNISVVNRIKLGTKMGLVSPEMFADKAVLVPEFLAKLPFGVFATSSIDALVHAVESNLSPFATPYTQIFATRAIELIIAGYQKIVKEGREVLPSLMNDFLMASNFAGIAFGTAGCGPVHAMAYPLGGCYHVAHGESNYACFTGVMKFYLSKKQDGAIAVLNRLLAGLLGCDEKVVYDKLEELLNGILPKKALHEYGVKKEECAEFAKSVMETQQRLMGRQFVPMTEDDVRSIYEKLY